MKRSFVCSDSLARNYCSDSIVQIRWLYIKLRMSCSDSFVRIRLFIFVWPNVFLIFVCSDLFVQIRLYITHSDIQTCRHATLIHSDIQSFVWSYVFFACMVQVNVAQCELLRMVLLSCQISIARSDGQCACVRVSQKPVPISSAVLAYVLRLGPLTL